MIRNRFSQRIQAIFCAMILGLAATISCRPRESYPQLFPVLWQQTSAEYRAICYQTFNLAKWSLKAQLDTVQSYKEFAIVADLDETLIDNSYCYGKAIISDTEPDWNTWKSLGIATAVPGSVEFLNWASELGIVIIYISNRDTSEIRPTILNMRRIGFPDSKPENCLLRAGDPSKQSRRRKIEEEYEVLLYLGDNLQDFSKDFENSTVSRRREVTDHLREYWGTKYVVLPNAIYGDWLNTLYAHDLNLPQQRKLAIYKENLIGY